MLSKFNNDMNWNNPSRNSLTDSELNDLLDQYELWINTDGTQGKLINLENKILVGMNFQNRNIQKINLEKTNLSDSNFTGANLKNASLKNANLRNVNFTGANLAGANFSHANLHHINLNNSLNVHLAGGLPEQVIPNFIKFEIKEKEQKIEELNRELSELSKNKENSADIQNLKNQINILQKEIEEGKNNQLNEHITNAQKVLSKSLESADKRIAEHTRTAKYTGVFAMILISLDVILILLFPFMIWFGDFSEKSTLFKLADKFGSWSFALYTFPIMLILLIATTLFRHQKKLLDEIRHFSATKHQIELYSGLLKASQHAAAGLGDTEQSAKYVQETFTEIRNRLLQQHANDSLLPTIHNESESYSQENILVLLEKIVDLGGKKTGN